jgi:hypothetical protein
MADFQEMLDFPPAPKLDVFGKLDAAKDSAIASKPSRYAVLMPVRVAIKASCPLARKLGAAILGCVELLLRKRRQ